MPSESSIHLISSSKVCVLENGLNNRIESRSRRCSSDVRASYNAPSLVAERRTKKIGIALSELVANSRQEHDLEARL